MSPRKSKSDDTVQATLGELLEEEPKKTKKKKTLSRPKKSTKKKTRKSTRKKSKSKKTPSKKQKKKKSSSSKKIPPDLSFSHLPGVGKKTEKLLKEAGYKSLSELAKAKYTSLAKEVKGISKSGAKDLIKAAKKELKEPEKKEVKAKKPSKKKPRKRKKTSKKVKKPKSKKPTPSGPPLSALSGVGKKLSSRLIKAGYSSLLELSKARYKTVAKKVEGISETRAKDLIKAAKKELKEPEKKEVKAKKPSKKKKTRKKKKPDSKKEPPTDKAPPGPPLSELPGVGKKMQERLIKAGYASVLKLSKARYTSVAKKVDGISKTGAKDLIEAAKDQIQKTEKKDTGKSKAQTEEITKTKIELTEVSGVGSKLAKRLEASGYDSVARLSRANAESLAKRVSHLSSERADSIIHTAKEMIRSRQLESIEDASRKKTPPPEAEKQPEPEKETKKSVTPKKKSRAKKSRTPKKGKKPTKKKEKVSKKKKPTKPKKKRSKIKRKKSGLPVPKTVEKLTGELRKRWRKAEKTSRKPEEGEPDREETVEVVELTTDETSDKLVDVATEILNETMITGRPAFEIPSRSGTNIVWDELRDLLLLGMRTISRPYHSLGSVVDATRTARVMEIVFQLLRSNLHATKREIYYSDVNLFRKQRRSDKIIEDVAAMLQTTRDSIHVVASARGSAMGRVVIRDGGDLIDLTKMGTGGWAITPFLDQVEIVESDAEYILLSEKDAAVMRLAESKYWNRQPCIVLTGKGSGDIATRAFLRRLVKELEIPAFALVDSDPYGHYIYSVFLRGSKRLSYESPFIATPELKLLGVLSRDLDEYEIPKSVRIPMESSDIKRVKDMLKEPFVKNNKPWVKDLKLMLRLKEKAEIQAFASHSFEYLTDEYLPKKLETGDWI